MTLSRQKLAPLFVFLGATLLALPVISKIQQTPVSAAVQQDQSQSDVKPAVKPTPINPGVSATAPTNDTCANAVNIASCPFTDTRSTAGATTEPGEPAPCGGIGGTVWYTYENTSSNPAVVTAVTCNGSSYDTALAAYKVTGAACAFAGFVNVACNDDSCGLQSSIQFTADPNSTYKIQAGGFAGGTGNLTLDVSCQVLQCPPVVINGTLGSGDPGFPGVQFSGDQTGRLNRNGIGSSCAAPKACLIFDPAGLRKFDAYEIPNESGEDQCVSINLTEAAGQTCNLQSNAYLDTYSPSSICTGYLGDPGLSTGVPPTPTNFSVTVPAGHTLIVVVHTTNPGEVGCAYTVTVRGNLCVQFDYFVQDDKSPARIIAINSMNGNYKYCDFSKGITLTGSGSSSIYFCKIEVFDLGPDPKRPDRFIDVRVNSCTFVGDATIQLPTGGPIITLHDSDVRNSSHACH